MKLTWLLALALLLASGIGRAAEITTNGVGGGPWSDPTTWRNNKLPGSADDVVIRKGDAVVFDRNDDGKITCRKLFLDPKGALLFKTGTGKQVFCAADAIESYGTIKLDGTRSADDVLELRLVGAKAENRTLKLLKGASLIVAGRARLPGGKHNVRLAAPQAPGQKEEVLGLVEAGQGVGLDCQRADIHAVVFKVRKIDNTGAKPNERLNVIGNHFTGQARVELEECDTPVIAGNHFEYGGKKTLGTWAIRLFRCSLPELRANVIRCNYNYGIHASHTVDGAMTGNTIEKAAVALHWAYSENSMIKQTTIRGCRTGIELHYGTAILEDNTIDGARTAVRSHHATAQFTTLLVHNLPRKAGVALQYELGGTLTLLNCNIIPSQIKLEKMRPRTAKEPPTRVTAMNYLVVGIKGAPADTQVEVKTAKAKPVRVPGAADLNVRNSPATIISERTPLPQSLAPLIVKSWTIDQTGKTVPAPVYTVRVLERAKAPGARRKVLKTLTVQPKESWFRAKPNSPAATLEVNLK